MSALESVWNRLTGKGRAADAAREPDVAREHMEHEVRTREVAAIRKAASETGDEALWALATVRRRELEEMNERLSYTENASGWIGRGR